MSFGILMDNPKNPHHVGQAVRIAACYGGEFVAVVGERCKREVDSLARIPREERMKDYDMVKLWWYTARQDSFNVVTRLADTQRMTPVCVEFDPSAEILPHFAHPYRPLYIFGPEDGDVRQGFRTVCHRFVTIPTAHCLNLGHAMATVCYDAVAKAMVNA